MSQSVPTFREALVVFSHTFDSIFEARFAQIANRLTTLEQRVANIETRTSATPTTSHTYSQAAESHEKHFMTFFKRPPQARKPKAAATTTTADATVPDITSEEATEVVEPTSAAPDEDTASEDERDYDVSPTSPSEPQPEIEGADVTTVTTPSTDVISIATHTADDDDNEAEGNSWYQFRIAQPTDITSTSPEHLMRIMYKIIESKACAVKKYISTIVLEKDRPVLYMVLHVGKNTIQTHYIQRWNNNEKSSIITKKIRRNDAILKAFNNVSTTTVTPELISYRERYQAAIPKSVVWGSLTPTYINTYMGM